MLPPRFTFMVAAAALCFTHGTHALTFSENEYTCPIDGEVFKATLPGSGTQLGIFTDMMPFGPIAAPWPMPRCPANGFVIFKTEFSPEELNKLKPYVNSEAYQQASKVEADYFLSYMLRTQLGENLEDNRFVLLRASWKPRGHYERYAKLTHQAMLAALANPKYKTEEQLNHDLIAGELERRLQQFDIAQARFKRLQSNAHNTPNIAKIIELQLSLIERKNSHQQLVPR